MPSVSRSAAKQSSQMGSSSSSKIADPRTEKTSSPKKLKKAEHIIIRAKRWFDKVNGNTYHSVEVYADGKLIGREPFTYGYGEQYNDTAHKILQDKGYYPKTDKKLSSGMDADYYNYRQDQMKHRDKFLSFVDDVERKKDL